MINTLFSILLVFSFLCFADSKKAGAAASSDRSSAFGIIVAANPGVNTLVSSPTTTGAQLGIGGSLAPFFQISSLQFLKFSFEYHKFNLKSDLPGTTYELSSQLMGAFVIYDFLMPVEHFDWVLGVSLGYTQQTSTAATTTNNTIGSSVRTFDNASALGWTIEGGCFVHWNDKFFSPFLFRGIYWGERLGDGYPMTLSISAGLGLYF